MEIAKLIISILGFAGAITTFWFAIAQYKRSEQWKRGEFVAREMKEFESNPAVRNALLMIDWGKRRINLFLAQNPTKDDYYTVTRAEQWRALLPHPIKPDYPCLSWSDVEASVDEESAIRFSSVEAKIRDTYDVFLDYLERFANFMKSDLIRPDEFKPYLIYWVDSIVSDDGDEQDTSWRFTLLTYISYYNYTGVKYVFAAYGKNIEPDGNIYRQLSSSMKNDVLRRRLYESITHKNDT